MAKKIAETPLMQQYADMKKKHPDAILLFRVGDFYETFCEDAISASEILGITLTRRANGKASSIELAGFPHHALDTYLPKLVRAGRRVAICEQLEDPKLAKKLVKRGITELITPGVNSNDASLPARRNNYLAGVHFMRVPRSPVPLVGVAFLDITTGEFLCGQGSPEFVDKLIGNVAPAEVLRMRGLRHEYEERISYRCPVNEMDDWVYTTQAARERLMKHFRVSSLKGFGLEGDEAAVIAAGSLLHYLDYTQHTQLNHIDTLSKITDGMYMHLDSFTARNLELVAPACEGGQSLYDVINRTRTPMGARMLRKWVLFPEINLDEIHCRQDCVEYFFRDRDLRAALLDTLAVIGDMERLTARMTMRRTGGRELLSLRDAMRGAMTVRAALEASDCEALRAVAADMPDLSEAVADITATIHYDAPSLMGKGQTIATGVDVELDRLRVIAGGGREALAEIERRESELTGIPSLKIGNNNVFGYYIEVRNTHKDKVPESWIRKQTLVSAERYITPELKEYEQTIFSAEERIAAMESHLLNALLDRLAMRAPAMVKSAAAIGRVDCLLSFASVAEAYGYVRPVVDDSLELDIREGRHPVIERNLPPGQTYVSNSVALDCDTRQIIMLTGPNMSGKSALLRQTALIVLLAQIGSCVPAQSAHIGLIDKIFTRVGASDNISGGESTFMVEMSEAASILNNMSQRSLILFDELGRGTSTYDGISLAWSIVEHIHDNGRVRPKTLFATHYHELNEMEKTLKRVANFNVSVKEIDGKVVFVRKLERGGSAHSFGIHVARLAGMPPSIVKRSEQVLSMLEEEAKSPGQAAASKADVSRIGKQKDGYQLSLFQLDDPLLSQIRDRLLKLDINNLTPLQALTTLQDLQGLLKG